MKPLLLAAIVCVIAGVPAAPACAQFAKPEDALRYRKAAFTVMAVHFTRVASMANGRMPFDAKAALDSAETAALMSRLPYSAFGDVPDKGETQAKPEVWTDKARFKAAAERSQSDMIKLSSAVKTGDLATIKAAVGAAGRSCKACHDDFRRRGLGE